MLTEGHVDRASDPSGVPEAQCKVQLPVQGRVSEAERQLVELNDLPASLRRQAILTCRPRALVASESMSTCTLIPARSSASIGVTAAAPVAKNVSPDTLPLAPTFTTIRRTLRLRRSLT